MMECIEFHEGLLRQALARPAGVCAKNGWPVRQVPRTVCEVNWGCYNFNCHRWDPFLTVEDLDLQAVKFRREDGQTCLTDFEEVE